jgi:molybdate/tungstate transport system ATP-binding protein
LIRLVDVSTRAGAFALRSINLEVSAGEYFVLLGPTGAGKTLLLETIAGLRATSSGEIWIHDQNVTALAPEERRVGFTYQDYLLFPHLSVRKNIAFGLRHASDADERIAQIARLLKLEHLLERRVAGLSGGEQQRVALARALAPKPRVLLLDEPLAALDPQTRQQVRRDLLGLHEELKMTTIHVTHDFEEALALADRLAVMNAGEIVQSGEADEVFRRPASPFMARFLGVENVLRGKVSRSVGGETRNGSFFNAVFESGALKLSVVAEREGAGRVAIRPEQITVSKEPLHSSALNNLAGVVKNIERSGPLVRLTIDTGQIFIAALTVQSFEALEIAEGSQVWLSFKATAVHVF